MWDLLKGVAEANKCVPHMMQVLDAAGKAAIRVFYADLEVHCGALVFQRFRQHGFGFAAQEARHP
jgi:hypothetical protein